MFKKIKKKAILLSAVVAITTIFTGCGSNSSAGTDDGKIHIVATIFPEYDWATAIVGDNDNVEVSLLLSSGVDIHSYQPSVADIVTISTCDIFIYVGGESDSWVDDALEQAANPDMKILNLMDILGDSVKEEEVVEGMQEEEHDHDDEDHDHESDEHDEEEAEYDEHVWLSVKNARTICKAIADAITLLDADNAASYEANLAAYDENLASLDSAYQNMVDSASQTTLVFGDRFPFRYMTDDYGLDYYAAFVGCSAETEASFETITFLSGKLDELELDVIFTIENSDQKLANTIVENTEDKNQSILVLDSMQSVTSDDIAAGTTYLSIMESNLSILKEALN